MAQQSSGVVIIGGGLAGAKTAEALRTQGYDGPVTLICGERHLPYERPPLSKEHLAGKKELADFTVHDADWYREHRVDLRLGVRATAIETFARLVTLSDGDTVEYTDLVLATGSSSRRPPIPGSDSQGVHYLRTIEESDELISSLREGTRLAVIGGGWIGLEVAATARGRGVSVTVVEAAELPLLAALGPELAQVFADLHRAHGVDLRLSAQVTEITTAVGLSTGLALGDGGRVASDTVLVAVGAAANIDIARDAGLRLADGGVEVDAGLRTSAPHVYAVGDIAAAQNPLFGARIRTEHWANALNQPAVAASNILGGDAVFAKPPYFFTDQYDLGMEYTGHAAGYTQVVLRGDTAAREFIAFWLDGENRVLAGMNVNIWDATDTIKELITARKAVDPQRLADVGVPLGDLV